MFYSDTMTLVNNDFSHAVVRLILFSWFGFVSNTEVYLILTCSLKFIIALIYCVFDEGNISDMQCNGFSNLEIFRTKIRTVGFGEGWNSFQVKSGLAEDLDKYFKSSFNSSW